jgi:hypothetical protein
LIDYKKYDFSLNLLYGITILKRNYECYFARNGNLEFLLNQYELSVSEKREMSGIFGFPNQEAKRDSERCITGA